MREAAEAARSAESGFAVRSVVLASADAALRHRLRERLTDLRWTVREAGGGAEAMALVEQERPEALLVDTWLPDLEAGEVSGHLARMYPAMDLLQMDGGLGRGATGARSPRRHELLHAMREAQEPQPGHESQAGQEFQSSREAQRGREAVFVPEPRSGRSTPGPGALPSDAMVGESPAMQELARMIRLVAPRSATVLIEGETGTGKEVVAKALHRMSGRAAKPLAVLNCAAIPEALLEAELFGHTRGAFTGAVQSRMGRIEAANGGTLLLDEIGEMPMALQAKMLRFLECGELQRVGENETLRVDVRVIAATHQPLERRAEEKTFRLDLYHRLAVFPLEVPALRDRMEDLPLLVEFFLARMAREHALRGVCAKRISAGAMEKLRTHHWPGNVRELMHVLERGAILADERPEIGGEDIRLRRCRTDEAPG